MGGARIRDREQEGHVHQEPTHLQRSSSMNCFISRRISNFNELRRCYQDS
jgi:hypothetical protein